MINWFKNIFQKDKKSKITYQPKEIIHENKVVVNDIVSLKNQEAEDDIEPEICESDNATDFIWCLIGNVIDEHERGTEKEIKHGTKHFSPNTKLYCFPVLWGDGYENIKVIGKHRKSSRKVCLVTPSKFIQNWRLQKVYKPHVIKIMRSQHGWTSSDKDKKSVLGMVDWLNDIRINKNQ